MKLPCGQCIGCRLAKSREWATRCMHEAQTTHDNGEKSCFITLTYDDFHLPPDHSLNKSHFQNFMKSLRGKYPDRRIRYFHCGEYGESCKICGKNRMKCQCMKFTQSLGRPHYHAILFGIDFPDMIFHSQTNGIPVYKSATLAQIWRNGFNTIGNVTWESAAYVARYVTKKITGAKKYEHYQYHDWRTDQLHELLPEYITMSLRPTGIGADFLTTYLGDVYPHGTTIVRGHETAAPRYYDKLYERWHPIDYHNLKLNRTEAALKLESHPDNTDRRLLVREFVHEQKSKLLKRSYEQE